MFFVLIIASLLVAITTVLPETRFTHWIVRGLDFPRIQIAVFGVVVLLLLL